MNKLGIIYQIRDDYQNLRSEIHKKNKGFGEDLTEGKFSFPVIHSLSAVSENPPVDLVDILRQRTEDEAVKLSAIQYMESTGSFEYCRQRLIVLHEEALEIVADLETSIGPCPLIRRILDMLVAS